MSIRHREASSRLLASNSTPSSDSRKPIHALLSIRPQYSKAIIDGSKRFEFRRQTFARVVDVAMVYATSPVQRVVCEFDVLGIITAPLDELWRLTWRFSG